MGSPAKAQAAMGHQVGVVCDAEGDALTTGSPALAALREQGIAATRQLAKRQWTWLRGELDARWFDPATQRTELEAAVAAFLPRGGANAPS